MTYRQSLFVLLVEFLNSFIAKVVEKEYVTIVLSISTTVMTKKSKKTSGSSSRRLIQTTKKYFSGLKKWQRRCLYVIFTIIGLVMLNTLIYKLTPEVKNPKWGTSFSTQYAKELGVDWKANFTALLDDLKIRNFRLMSYWDVSEPQPGVYNFSELDWQMDEAAKRGAKVSLSIGMRQPRWPECHKPRWAKNLSREDEDKAIMKFTLHTVGRYKDHPALESYQLENEAVNNWFGACTPDDTDQKRLDKEFIAVKKADPNHPVYMSLSDQHGLPLNKPVPDKYGFSVYRIVWNDKSGPFKFYLTYPTPIWYHSLRAKWIKTFKDRDIFIHELQVEPWGPTATVNMSVDEQNQSMSPDQIKTNIQFARKIGEPEIYTWGSEWWYWRKTHFKDPTIWETVRGEINRD